MTYSTLANDKILRKEFIEKYIFTKMNPELRYMNLFRKTNLNGATTFEYMRDETSAEDDIQKGVMSEPIEVSELSKLSKIEISGIEKKLGDTAQFGYAMEFSEQKLRENGIIDDILRFYDRAAYGMARKINIDILNNMKNFAAADPITLNDGSWDDSEMITEDLIDMKRAFEIEGYPYRLSDIFLQTDNYYEANKYYKKVDGSFNPGNIEGLAFHNIMSDIEEGKLIGIDKKVSPLTLYYNKNPKHSVIPNSFININKVTEDKYPFVTRIEMWAEMGLACKEPKAILLQDGI